ncbi:Uncharacterised protein [Mycobacteroides abscessus]|nr:Uncharacterised protein [Mycobacteroides abscessus]
MHASLTHAPRSGATSVGALHVTRSVEVRCCTFRPWSFVA